MQITTKSFFSLWCAAGLCLFFLHFSAVFSYAVQLHLNGNWGIPYGDDDGPWVRGQTYNLSLSHDPTAMINLNGNIRYTTSEQQGTDTTKTLAPSLSAGVTNDLFRFNLSGSQNIRKKGDDPKSTNKSWNSTFSTNYKKSLWPQLRLSYGESRDDDDEKPAKIDSKSENFSGSIDYYWEFIKLRYNYRNDINKDKSSSMENKVIGHSTNVQMVKNLFDNRLSLSASHKYSINKTKTSTSVDGGQVVVDLIASAAYAGIDDTPTTDPLPPLPTLNDQDFLTATSAEIPDAGQKLNLALKIDLQTFDRLRLYFDRHLPIEVQQRLHWSFYTSLDNDDWELLSTISSIDYIEEAGNDNSIARVIFSDSVTKTRYIKAVVEADPGFSSAFFTEIVAQEKVSGSAGTVTNKYTSEDIQASVNYRPWRPLQLGYSFNHNVSNADRSARSVQDDHIISTHLNLNRYFNLSLSAGEHNDKIKGVDKDRTRTYAFSYQTTPFDSTNFSLNGTRNNHYIGSKKDQSTDSISTNIATVIVPDLTANLTYQWTYSRDYIDDKNTRTNSYISNLVARINPRLNLSYLYSYNETSTHNASLLYHPSELLSFTASAMVKKKTQSYAPSLHWRMTDKIQTDLRYILSFNDQQTTHNVRFQINWDISSHLSVRNNMDWTKDGSDQRWSGLIVLSYNF